MNILSLAYQRRRNNYWLLLFLTACAVLISDGALAIMYPPRGGGKKRSPYDVLGVSSNANQRDIQRAYRKASLKCHPDKPGGSEEAFKEVNHAYDILNDPQKRQQYDQFGTTGGSATPPPQSSSSFFRPTGSSSNNGYYQHHSFSSFEDFFGSSFAGPGRSSSSSSSSPLEEMIRQMMMGQGAGGASYFQSQRPPHKTEYTRPAPCTLEELFRGSKKRFRVKLNQYTKTFTIQLKPGWKTGTKVSFPPTSDFPFTIVFQIEEKEHPRFTRVGNDLIYRHATSHPSNRIEITLPDGEVFAKEMSSLPAHFQKGHKITVSNKGMPIKGGPQRGDLIIELV